MTEQNTNTDPAARPRGSTAQVPLVTICVPTIGRMEYLPQVLAAALGQTHPRCEILVLDNASPDPAREVIEAFADAHPQVRVLRVEERVPSFANFNRGIRVAAGEYVTFFHDDDFYAPRFVERYVELLERHPEAGFVGGNFDLLDGDGERTRTQKSFTRTEVWPGARYIEEVFRTGRNPMPTPGMLFRRNLIQRFDFDESLPVNWGDFTIFMRMAETTSVAVTDEVLYAWRVHGQNGSNVPGSRSIPLRTTVLRDYLAEYSVRHPDQGEFAARLEALLARSHEIGLLWGWVSAPSDGEAEACRTALRGVAAPMSLAVGALGLLERVGFSARRRQALLPVFRRIGEALGA
jgi:glycosyltransferase involved in cell wall biosynthesis